MRTFGGGFVSGLLPVLVLLMAIVAADDSKTCFNASGSDVVFKGTCTTASTATIEVGAKAFSAVIAYDPAGEIGAETKFDLKIAGCEFKSPRIRDDDSGGTKTATLFVNQNGYDFPATVTVSESAVEIKGNVSGQEKKICSTPQFADLAEGKFASNVSIDLKGKAVPSLSITIKGAKLHGAASSEDTSAGLTILWIVLGVVAAAAVIASSVVGVVVYFCKCRKSKKKEVKKPDDVKPEKGDDGKEPPSPVPPENQQDKQEDKASTASTVLISEDWMKVADYREAQAVNSMPFPHHVIPPPGVPVPSQPKASLPTAKASPAQSGTPTGWLKGLATSQAEQAVGVQSVTAVDDAGAAQQTSQEVQAAEPVKPEKSPHPALGLRHISSAVKDQPVKDKDIEAFNEALDQIGKANERTTWDKSLTAFLYACSTRVLAQ